MLYLLRVRHALSLMLILALWLALATFTAWDARTELRSVSIQTETLADALAAHTSRVLREADALAAVVAWHVQRHGVSVPLGDYVSSGLFKLDVCEQVAVIDKYGIVRSSTVPGFVPVNVADREHFIVHVNDNSSRLYIGKAVIGRVSGKPSIQLSRRIDDAAGRFLGVVVISMAPTYLTELYDALRIGDRGMISVVDTDDFVLRARRSGSSSAVDLQLPPHDPLRAALARMPKEHFSYVSPIDGVNRIVSYERLADYPVAVVVGFSLSDYLQAFRGRLTVLAVSGLILTILILAAEAYRAGLLKKMAASAERERDANNRRILKAQRIESLFMAIPDAAIGFSAQGEIDGYNPYLLTLLGWTPRELAHATPTLLAAAFFRHDQSPDREVKAAHLALMLCDKSAEGAVSAVFRLEVSEPVVYEVRVERRYGSSTGTVALIRDITVQSRINDSERDLESMLHAIGDAVVSVDEHGCIKRMNPVAEIFSGCLNADAIGQPHSEVFPLISVTTGSHAAVPVDSVLKTGQVLRLGDRRTLTSMHGEKRNVAISAAPIRGSGDRISGAVVVLRDVSREYASEQALMQSEARYRQLIALSPYAVFLGQNRQIKFANPKALEMLGAHTAQQVVGRCVLDFLHPDSIPAVEQRMAQLHNDRTMVPPMEEKWLRLDGSTFIGEAMAVPYEIDGAPAVLAMLQDISSRKEAEAERDRLFALSLDLTCLAEPGGYFKRVNPAFSKVLGWTSEELLSKPYIEFIHPDDRAATVREIELHRSGEPIDHFENRYLCKDGSSRWLAWKAIEVDGAVYATARDVTESRIATQQLEQARAEAEAASRAKSAFLATMSHEIRTPMNGVIGMTEVLARTALTPAQDDMVCTIRESANSLLTIIDDILDFSKIEAGRLQIERAPVAIVDLVENVCTSLMPVAKSAGVRLAPHIALDVPDVVLSDDTRLKQLLYNLVGNAIKFSGRRPGETGAVSVRLDLSRHAPLEIRMQVADDGIGMSEETMAGLFMPFNQAEVSTTRRFGGTGLGLAICRRLVDLMGGSISVSSRLGVGSTFTIHLPFEVPSAQQLCEQPDLDGVSCVVMHSTRYDVTSVCAWLDRALGQVVVVDDLVAAQQAIQNSRTPVLLVRDDPDELPVLQPTGLAENFLFSVCELRIAPGLRNAVRLERGNIVVIGAEGLRRQSLKDAAIMAVGRATIDIASETANKSVQDSHKPPMTVAQAREDGRLILVAEDDEINQKVILRQLALLGHVAEVASDGTEALELWRAGRYALLLTDLHMPEMDGYELVEVIRREEKNGVRLPIIALTANAIQGEAARATAAGMDGYLTKPLHLVRLQAVLEQHFPVRQAALQEEMRSAAIVKGEPDCAVDTEVLKSIVGDDADTVRELLGDYLKSVRNLAAELRAHCEDGRGREAGSVAHKLKSSSRSIGAIALGNLCAELENAGKAGDLAMLANWVQQFDAALAAVEHAIARMLEMK